MSQSPNLRETLGLALTWILLSTSTAGASDWEWRSAIALESSATPHGIIDLATRQGAFSLAIQTDTVDIRYSPEYQDGKWWVGGRLAAFGAELLFSPWLGGAPLPEAALRASYGGLDGGYVHYLPHHWYAGIRASARLYDFGEVATTEVSVPPRTHRVSPELLVGHWTKVLQLEAAAGLEWVGDDVVPFGHGRIKLMPSWELSPIFNLYGGYLGESMPPLARARVGGLNPYVVPLAGAAWGEWWARRYAIARSGLVWTLDELQLSFVYDAGFVDTSDLKHGGALASKYEGNQWDFEVAIARGLGVSRQPTVSAWSGWISYSRHWQSF